MDFADIILAMVVFIPGVFMGVLCGGFYFLDLLENANKEHTIINKSLREFIGYLGCGFWGVCIVSMFVALGYPIMVLSVIINAGLSVLFLVYPVIYCRHAVSQIEQEERIRQEQLDREERIRQEQLAREKEKFERRQRTRGLVKFVNRHGKEKWGSPKQVEEWKRIDIGMKDGFSSLSPKEFERFIGDLFAKMGFHIKLGPYVRDFGADIIAKKGEDKVLVQVKKYGTGHNVGARDVQRTLGSMWKHKANKSILVTTSDFTVEAHEQARGAPIELWNRGLLYKMIDRYFISIKNESQGKEIEKVDMKTSSKWFSICRMEEKDKDNSHTDKIHSKVGKDIDSIGLTEDEEEAMQDEDDSTEE